ncbi:MAG: TetR/AcrR family transcriptional regulator [Prevotella sp.]|nr:TetR/AcrR family transcriptional regulator [Prevotella sp.]
MSENTILTSHKQQLHERIVETAMKAFTAQGIRAVKMDDIARRLGISKRTLYELYETKEAVLHEGIMHYHSIREQHIMQLLHEGKSVIEIVMESYRQRLDELHGISPLFYDDLKKYPLVLKALEEMKEASRQQFADFLQRGIHEGYFRGDLDYDIVPLMFDAIGHYIMSRELYRHYDLDEIFKSLVFTSLRGICTEKGTKALDNGL